MYPLASAALLATRIVDRAIANAWQAMNKLLQPPEPVYIQYRGCSQPQNTHQRAEALRK